MTSFSEARRRRVVELDSAHQVAEVESFVVDPRERRVVLLRLRKVKAGAGSLLDWSAVRGFGPDAVTVESASAFREARDEHEQRAAKGDLDLPGRRVLSDGGRELGRVDDVEFDPESGAVLALVTDAGRIPGERLLGVGSYAVTVREG